PKTGFKSPTKAGNLKPQYGHLFCDVNVFFQKITTFFINLQKSHNNLAIKAVALKCRLAYSTSYEQK
ncbi:MAG TPA: hypothetical protein PK690_13910, partial [Emcibacteraceae bacterium]|nr:hypothetical protein [Emcibacteraceae bacterium]